MSEHHHSCLRKSRRPQAQAVNIGPDQLEGGQGTGPMSAMAASTATSSRPCRSQHTLSNSTVHPDEVSNSSLPQQTSSCPILPSSARYQDTLSTSYRTISASSTDIGTHLGYHKVDQGFSRHQQKISHTQSRRSNSTLIDGRKLPTQPVFGLARDTQLAEPIEGNVFSQFPTSNTNASFHNARHISQSFQNGHLEAKDNSRITFVTGDQTNYTGRDGGREAIETLKAHCAPSALLNSKERYDIPSCAEETRIAVLQTLIAWVERAGLSALLGWLRGPAGAGKSTIAQTLAEECKKKGLLAATFFFSRTGSAERADGDRLIPTIILQLILKFPELRSLVIAAIAANPIFFKQSRRLQLEELLVKPFCKDDAELSDEDDQSNASPFHLAGNARLIIIDGLDECNSPAVQIDLLKIIGDATRRLPHPFRFLIVSRPEAHIADTINHKLTFEDNNPLRIDLDNDPDADADIRRYLELEFNRMRTQHPNHQLLPSPWPPVGAVNTLAERASKQFIYPAVVLNFIWNNEDFPAQSLQLILNLKLAKRSPERPLAILDELYTFVFSKVLDKHLDTIARLFSILVYRIPLGKVSRSREGAKSIAVLERCLRLPQGQLSILLKPLLSLLSIPSDLQKSIKVYHASLSDFLKDPKRSSSLKFRISKGCGWEALALYWLHCDQPKKAERRHHSICEAVSKADPTDELRMGIVNYDIPLEIMEKTANMWGNISVFVEMLCDRPDIHHEDFALLRHHISKIIRTVEAELIRRKIWSRGKRFEKPALLSNNIVLNTQYRLIDALCRFRILVGWDLCGESHVEGSQCRLILTFLGQNREFTDYFTLEVIDRLAYSLREPNALKEGKDRVVCRFVRRVVQSRLLELSQTHGLREIMSVMDKCQIEGLKKV